MIKVAVGIILRNGEVLLCQRKSTARYALKWEFPGGKVEDAESVEDCLERELDEELGIDAEIGPLYHRQHYEYADSGTYDVFYHLIIVFTGEIQNRAFEKLLWVPLDQLPAYDILEGNRVVVSMLVNSHARVDSATK